MLFLRVTLLLGILAGTAYGLDIPECHGGWVEILETNNPPSVISCGPFSLSETTSWTFEINKVQTRQIKCGSSTCECAGGEFCLGGKNSGFRTLFIQRLHRDIAANGRVICNNDITGDTASCSTNVIRQANPGVCSINQPSYPYWNVSGSCYFTDGYSSNGTYSCTLNLSNENERITIDGSVTEISKDNHRCMFNSLTLPRTAGVYSTSIQFYPGGTYLLNESFYIRSPEETTPSSSKVAGIVVGVVAVAVVIAVVVAIIVVVFVRRRRSQKQLLVNSRHRRPVAGDVEDDDDTEDHVNPLYGLESGEPQPQPQHQPQPQPLLNAQPQLRKPQNTKPAGVALRIPSQTNSLNSENDFNSNSNSSAAQTVTRIPEQIPDEFGYSTAGPTGFEASKAAQKLSREELERDEAGGGNVRKTSGYENVTGTGSTAPGVDATTGAAGAAAATTPTTSSAAASRPVHATEGIDEDDYSTIADTPNTRNPIRPTPPPNASKPTTRKTPSAEKPTPSPSTTTVTFADVYAVVDKSAKNKNSSPQSAKNNNSSPENAKTNNPSPQNSKNNNSTPHPETPDEATGGDVYAVVHKNPKLKPLKAKPEPLKTKPATEKPKLPQKPKSGPVNDSSTSASREPDKNSNTRALSASGQSQDEAHQGEEREDVEAEYSRLSHTSKGGSTASRGQRGNDYDNDPYSHLGDI